MATEKQDPEVTLEQLEQLEEAGKIRIIGPVYSVAPSQEEARLVQTPLDGLFDSQKPNGDPWVTTGQLLRNGDVIGKVGLKDNSHWGLYSPKPIHYMGPSHMRGRVVEVCTRNLYNKPTFVERGAVLLLVQHVTPPQRPKGREGCVAVTSPLAKSQFFRQPRPGEPPFVEVGSKVNVGQELCLLMMMKQFSPLLSEVQGEVVEIVAENENWVDEKDVLMFIRPDTTAESS